MDGTPSTIHRNTHMSRKRRMHGEDKQHRWFEASLPTKLPPIAQQPFTLKDPYTVP